MDGIIYGHSLKGQTRSGGGGGAVGVRGHVCSVNTIDYVAEFNQKIGLTSGHIVRCLSRLVAAVNVVITFIT